MKKLNYLIIPFVLTMLISCKFEKKYNSTSTTISNVLQRKELIGHWRPLYNGEELKNLKVENLREINLKKDMTAEIDIQDSLGIERFNGNWKMDVVGGKMIPSTGLIIDYQDNKKDSSKIILFIEKNNEKVLFKSANITFEKE